LTARLLILAVLVVGLAAPAGATAAERGRVHAGTTSADDPIVLVRSGRELTRLAMQISARCAGGSDRVALLIDAPTGIAVRRNGRFAAEERLDAPLASGRTARGRLSVEGRVQGRRVKGTVRYRAKLLDAGCDDFIPKPFRSETLFDAMAARLGVRFVYESPGARARRGPLAPDTLAALPSEWLAALSRVVMEGDVEGANAVIDEIDAYDSGVAGELRRLVRGYRFDELHAAIESVGRSS